MAKTKLYLGAMPVILQALANLLDNELKIKEHIASLKGNRALSYTCGRSLLKYALLQDGYLSHNDLLPNISYSELGKPSIDLQDVYFNLSHSHDLMALSLGSYAQGIDIELCDEKRLRKSLLNKVLNDSEQECFKAINKLQEQANFFTRQWTLRECLLKVKGHSIFSMDKLVIDPINRKIQAPNYPSGIIATFEINVSEYFKGDDKIYQLANNDKAVSSPQLIIDNSLNKIDSVVTANDDLTLQTVDYLPQDVKKLDKINSFYQLSVFLELDCEKYNNLKLAVADNLEVWVCLAMNNTMCQHCPFTPIKCSPKSVFSVN